MFRTDQPTAASALPAPAPAGAEGYFTNGNPASGVPATILDADWLNMTQEELLNIVEAAGLTPSKTTYDQVLLAIQQMISARAPGVIGSARNLAMSVTAASATATLTADEIIVESGLGGLRYCLANFSETINLAITGAGGMDIGAAPATGFVALYAISNPATGAKALLATNATAANQSEVYGGANMPNGYTASALVSVWPTNSSGQFGIAFQFGRVVNFPITSALVTNSLQAGLTALSISTIVPPNARGVTGGMGMTNSTSGNNNSMAVAGNSVGVGQKSIGANFTTSTGGIACAMDRIPLTTPQKLYYSVSGTGGTITAAIQLSGYDF